MLKPKVMSSESPIPNSLSVMDHKAALPSVCLSGTYPKTRPAVRTSSLAAAGISFQLPRPANYAFIELQIPSTEVKQH